MPLPPRHRVHVLARIALAAMLLAAASVVAPGARAQEAPDPAAGAPLRPVGSFERIPAEARKLLGKQIVPAGFDEGPGNEARGQDLNNGLAGTMILIPHARRIVQLYPAFDFTVASGRRTDVLVRDLDTMAVTGTLTFEFGFKRGGFGSTSGEWLHAVDPAGRLFLMDEDHQNVVELDVRTLRHRLVPLPSHVAGVRGAWGGMQIGGLSWDTGRNALWMLWAYPGGGFAVAAVNTFLTRLDLGTGEFAGPRKVRSCDGSLPPGEDNTTYAHPVLVPEGDAEHVYVPCQHAGEAAAVVRLARDQAFDPASGEDMAVGPVSLETALADPASGRLFLVTKVGEVWVFDTATMAFVGVVGAASDAIDYPRVGYGLDEATGRLFFQSPSFGLGVAEGRFFPMPQAQTLPDLAADGQERLQIDPVTRRVFVLPGYSTDKANAYTIYEAGPAPAPPPPADPDQNTIDRPEKAGETESRYFGSASGYGFRAILANGVTTLLPSPGAGAANPIGQVLGRQLKSKCGFTDRELVAGRVTKAEADHGSTAAEAIAFDVDERTKLDLEQPSRCDATIHTDDGTERFGGIFATAPAAEPAVNSAGRRWERDPAACSSSTGGEAAADEGDDHGQPPLGASRVECPVPGEDLVAQAEASLTGAVSVGRAWSHTTISRRAEGVVVEAEALAQDVLIAGVVRIAEIRSVARSVSNGRPRTAPGSVHEISISGLRIGDTDVCGTCDPQAAVDALNRAGAGHVQFRIGTSGADRRLVTGTPKGASTAVQKSVERQASDLALIGDFSTDVPALEMVRYNDNLFWGRARQLYQFAGVSTAATYTIAMASAGGSPPPAGPLADAVAAGNAALDDVAGAAGVDDEVALDADPAAASSADDGGSPLGEIVERVVEAVEDALRFLIARPRQALLLLTAWGLLALPAILARRRRLLAAVA